MAKRSHSFVLKGTVAATSRAVREALGRPPWELTEAADRLVVREDATRLCCTISPVSAEIRVVDEDPGTVRIDLDGSVPGWGIIASRQLTDRMAALERLVRESCAQRG